MYNAHGEVRPRTGVSVRCRRSRLVRHGPFGARLLGDAEGLSLEGRWDDDRKHRAKDHHAKVPRCGREDREHGPHPVVIFLILIGIVIVLSAVLGRFGATVSFERIKQDTHQIETAITVIRSPLMTDGIRFMYSSLIPNFMGFTAVGLMIVAMIGAGVAEKSGLVTALIRKLVIVSTAWALTYILAFVGIIASIAADAGYLVLIPLAGIAYLAVGRHPLAGLALGFAAVSGDFTVNMLIKPLDAVLVEFTNDAARLVDPSRSIGLVERPSFRLYLRPFTFCRVIRRGVPRHNGEEQYAPDSRHTPLMRQPTGSEGERSKAAGQSLAKP